MIAGDFCFPGNVSIDVGIELICMCVPPAINCPCLIPIATFWQSISHSFLMACDMLQNNFKNNIDECQM